MLPDRVSNPEPLTYESGALPTALLGPAEHAYKFVLHMSHSKIKFKLTMHGHSPKLLSLSQKGSSFVNFRLPPWKKSSFHGRSTLIRKTFLLKEQNLYAIHKFRY